MSTLEYKWWCRKYTKQLILRRLLRREQKRDQTRKHLTEDERREIAEMLAGLTTQIERRKQDIDAILNRPPCERCGRTTAPRDLIDGRALCRDKKTCGRLASKARRSKAGA